MTGIIIDFAHQKLVKPTNLNNNIPTYSNYTVIKYPESTTSTEKITTIYTSASTTKSTTTSTKSSTSYVTTTSFDYFYTSASTTKSTKTSTKSTSYVTTTPFDYFRKLILLSENQTKYHCY